MSGETVNITLSKDNYYDPFKPILDKGQLIRLAKKKRVWCRVESVWGAPYNHSATLKAIYRPAPKSRLNNKSKFSKFKMKIIKLNT